MNGWNLLAPISSVLFALAAGQACAVERGPTPAAAPDAETEIERAHQGEGEVTQLADGCGAQRYLGTTSIECTRVGLFSGIPYDPNGSCTPGDEDHLTCDFPLLECEWTPIEVTTSCADGAAACLALIPTEPPPLPPLVLNLPPGSTLCVTGASTPEQRRNYCFDNRGSYYTTAKTFCQSQVQQESTDTSCCIDCTVPPPPQLGAVCAIDDEETLPDAE